MIHECSLANLQAFYKLSCHSHGLSFLGVSSLQQTVNTQPFLCVIMKSSTFPNRFGLWYNSLVKNCNHKGLGIYYLLTAFIFGISGTLISVLIRIELYSSGNRIISPENQNFYNISITLHGFLMIFFLVMPGLFGGFGNYSSSYPRSQPSNNGKESISK